MTDIEQILKTFICLLCLLLWASGATASAYANDVAFAATNGSNSSQQSINPDSHDLHLEKQRLPRRLAEAVGPGSSVDFLFSVGLVEFQTGHTDVVSAVAYSPVEPDLLASCSYDYTVRLWNTSSLVQLAVMTGHSAPINSVVFNKNGTLLASGDDNGQVFIWNVSSYTALKVLTASPLGLQLNGLSFSPDGSYLSGGTSPAFITGFRRRDRKLMKKADVGAEYRQKKKPLQDAFLNPSPLSAPSKSHQPSESLQLPTNDLIMNANERLKTSKHHPHLGMKEGGEGTEKVQNIPSLAEIIKQTLRGRLWGGSPQQDKEGSTKMWPYDLNTAGRIVCYALQGMIPSYCRDQGHVSRESLAMPTSRNHASITSRKSSAQIRPDLDIEDPKIQQQHVLPDSTQIRPDLDLEDLKMQQQHKSIDSNNRLLQKQPDGGINKRTLQQSSTGYYVIIWSMKNYSQVATLTGHTDVVTATSFSPNGTQMTSSSDDGSIRVWTVPTWRLVALLTGQLLVTDVAWAGDGITLASSSGSTSDMSVSLWSVRYRDRTAVLSGHTAGVTGVAFAPSGSFLASSSMDLTVRLWNWKLQQAVQVLYWSGSVQAYTSVAFSQSVSVLAAGNDDHSIRLWSIPSGLQLGVFQDQSLISLAFSPESPHFAVGLSDLSIQILDQQTRNVLLILEGHLWPVVSLSFSSGNISLLASADVYSSVRLWDLYGGGNQVALIPIDVGVQCYSAALSKSGEYLAMAWNNEVNVWDVQTLQPLIMLQGPQQLVRAVQFSPDGTMLASGSQDDKVMLWNTSSWEVLAKLSAHTQAVSTIGWSPDSMLLASGSYDLTIILWRVSAQAPVATLVGHTAVVTSVTFSVDGSLLASCANDGTVRLWDVATGQSLQTLSSFSSSFMNQVSFSSDGTLLGVAPNTVQVHLFGVSNGYNESFIPSQPPHAGTAPSSPPLMPPSRPPKIPPLPLPLSPMPLPILVPPPLSAQEKIPLLKTNPGPPPLLPPVIKSLAPPLSPKLPSPALTQPLLQPTLPPNVPVILSPPGVPPNVPITQSPHGVPPNVPVILLPPLPQPIIPPDTPPLPILQPTPISHPNSQPSPTVLSPLLNPLTYPPPIPPNIPPVTPSTPHSLNTSTSADAPPIIAPMPSPPIIAPMPSLPPLEPLTFSPVSGTEFIIVLQLSSSYSQVGSSSKALTQALAAAMAVVLGIPSSQIQVLKVQVFSPSQQQRLLLLTSASSLPLSLEANMTLLAWYTSVQQSSAATLQAQGLVQDPSRLLDAADLVGDNIDNVLSVTALPIEDSSARFGGPAASQSKSGLSTGQLAGIIVGSVLGLMCVLASLVYLLLLCMRKRWAMMEATVPFEPDWMNVSTVKVQIEEAEAPWPAKASDVFKKFSDFKADGMLLHADLLGTQHSPDAKEGVLSPYQVTHNSVFHEEAGSSLNSSLEAPIHGAVARALALLSPVSEEAAGRMGYNTTGEGVEQYNTNGEGAEHCQVVHAVQLENVQLAEVSSMGDDTVAGRIVNHLGIDDGSVEEEVVAGHVTHHVVGLDGDVDTNSIVDGQEGRTNTSSSAVGGNVMGPPGAQEV